MDTQIKAESFSYINIANINATTTTTIIINNVDI